MKSDVLDVFSFCVNMVIDQYLYQRSVELQPVVLWVIETLTSITEATQKWMEK